MYDMQANISLRSLLHCKYLFELIYSEYHKTIQRNRINFLYSRIGIFFQRHVDLHERDEKEPLFRCTICLVVCRDQDDFDNHSNLHKEVSPLQCIHCKRNFMQRGHLAKHMLSHVSILVAVKIGYTYLLRTLIFSSSVLVTWSIGRQLQGHY